MRDPRWSGAPALALAALALFAALGGTVYAKRGKRHRAINGRKVRAKSLPGNRIKPHSIPANRLKKGVIEGSRLSGPLTGGEINELTLGQVPSAAHADTADTAQSATDAQTSLNSINAVDAQTVNGHEAGCLAGTVPFAGACWEASSSDYDLTAAQAAAACADRGGTLPEALQLAAFAERPDVALDSGDEWSGDLTNYSGVDGYAAITVMSSGSISSALSTAKRHFRCVIPLLT